MVFRAKVKKNGKKILFYQCFAIREGIFYITQMRQINFLKGLIKRTNKKAAEQMSHGF